MGRRGDSHNINNVSFDMILIVLTVGIAWSSKAAEGRDPLVPAVFVFGDSSVDVGTNNFLHGTKALANFPFNGIDFPGSIPTGRFSNGFNLADQLAMLLGFEKSPPPYLSIANSITPKTNILLQGVNFASGGSGILYETGSHIWTRVVPLRDQVDQFAKVVDMVHTTVGREEGVRFIANSLLIISIGSNDILDYERLHHRISKERLIARIKSEYNTNLKRLYSLGARKFGIISVPPVGCLPYGHAMNKTRGGNGGCLDSVNDLAQSYYTVMNGMLLSMSTSELPEMKYALANLYSLGKFVIDHPEILGFKEVRSACCGKGEFNGKEMCKKATKSKLCENRREYMFWDMYHPTEFCSNVTATVIAYADRTAVKPINFNQLALLHLPAVSTN